MCRYELRPSARAALPAAARAWRWMGVVPRAYGRDLVVVGVAGGAVSGGVGVGLCVMMLGVGVAARSHKSVPKH